MSLWLNLGQLATRAGGLLPSLANLTSWLTQPTADGKTLPNPKGTDANLTAVNCLNFDGSNDHIDLISVPSDLLECVFDISFDILIDDSDTGFQRIIYFIGGNDFFRIQKNNGSNTLDFWARNSSSNTIFRNSSMSFTPDVMFSFRAIGDGTDVKVYYDDVLQHTISITGANKQASFTSATPTLSNSSTALKGKLANFKLSSGSVLHTQLPIAEGSGTKDYDVSGNGNHGTITGATWSTEDGIESWNHEYGFDIDGAVKVPALNTKTKQVATFDGVADEVNAGYNPSGDLIIDARIKADNISGIYIIHQCNGNTGYFFRISAGEWQLYVGNGYVFSSSTGIDPVAGTLYDTRVEYTASSNAWVVKVKVATDSTYTTVGSGTRTPTFSSANFILGQKGTTMYFDGEYHSFKITDGGATKVEYDFQSDIGTTTVQDLSTNNNDGTVTVGSGGLATFWGQRVADTSGSFVSADYAAGNTTISNPAGYVHNNSECGVDLVPTSITVSDAGTASVNGAYTVYTGSLTNLNPKANTTVWNQGIFYLIQQSSNNQWGIFSDASEDNSYYNNTATTNLPPKSGWTDVGEGDAPAPSLTYAGSFTATQLFAIDNSAATQTFIRKDNGNIVQILDYSAALTGSDLDRTRSYVG